MTMHDPNARDVLRAQLLQTIDGAAPDQPGNAWGLVERCDDVAGELGAMVRRVEWSSLEGCTGDRCIALLGDFRRFAMAVRTLITGEPLPAVALSLPRRSRPAPSQRHAKRSST